MSSARVSSQEERRLAGQRLAARFGGGVMLLAMALSILVEFVGFGPIVISDAARETADSLRASEPLIRIAAVGGMVCFIGDMAVAAAFYAVLRETNRGVALFAALLRTANAVVLALSAVALFVAFRLVSGPPYLDGFSTEQLDGLARFLFGVRAEMLNLGWVLLGLGQAAFAWLWLKSGLAPRWMAVIGVAASLLLCLTPLVLMVQPQLQAAIGLAYMAPMFLYEVVLGVWLLVRGVRTGVGLER